MSDWNPGEQSKDPRIDPIHDPIHDTAPLVPVEPVPAGVQPHAGETLVHIGEIQVTATTVSTPTGSFPVAGSQWFVQDQWTSTDKTPTWAIIAAVLGFCILTIFSLFFLLVKQSATQGFVSVTVSNGPHSYTARFPVATQVQVMDVHNRVNYARSLSSRR